MASVLNLKLQTPKLKGNNDAERQAPTAEFTFKTRGLPETEIKFKKTLYRNLTLKTLALSPQYIWAHIKNPSTHPGFLNPVPILPKPMVLKSNQGNRKLRKPLEGSPKATP